MKKIVTYLGLFSSFFFAGAIMQPNSAEAYIASSTPLVTSSTTIAYIDPELLQGLMKQLKALQEELARVNASSSLLFDGERKGLITITIDYQTGQSYARIPSGKTVYFNTTSTTTARDKIQSYYVSWSSDSTDRENNIKDYQDRVVYVYKNADVVVRYDLEVWRAQELYMVTRLASGTTTRTRIPLEYIKDIIKLNYKNNPWKYEDAVREYVRQIKRGERPGELIDFITFFTGITQGQASHLFFFDVSHYKYTSKPESD